MLSYILQAAENFCTHQIGLPYLIIPERSKKRTLIAYLDVETHQGKLFRTYFGCDETLLQRIGEIFLGEETLEKETLRDMLLETTNMVIGSAKVISEESSENPFNIRTPHFLAHEFFTIEVDEYTSLHLSEGEMFMALKAL